jgi:hypothetical protein
MAIYDLLPPGDAPDSDELLARFLEYVAAQGLTLYPAQEEALLALFTGQNVILNTPTGSGKTLVASALHFASLARGRRSVYTSPIKALVNEKWMALCRELGPIERGLSEVRFEYGGRDRVSPVVLGQGSDEPLLGAVTLETLGLVLNPLSRDVVPMRLVLARR